MTHPSKRALTPREVAVFKVSFDSPLGLIRGQATVDMGPMGLVDLVPTACELTNILVKRAARREENAGGRISCGPGCGACCHQVVPLSPPEAFYLVDLIDSFHLDRRSQLLLKFEAVVHELEKRQMIDELLDPQYSDDPVLAIAREYFHLQLSCPFLVDESCSIHPYRPVACREYNATSPADWCADPYTYAIEKVPTPVPLSASLSLLTSTLTDSKPRLIPLILAPHWVSKHSELKKRQWPGMELFKKFIDQLRQHPASGQ